MAGQSSPEELPVAPNQRTFNDRPSVTLFSRKPEAVTRVMALSSAVPWSTGSDLNTPSLPASVM
jgi:hypothetical protein